MVYSIDGPSANFGLAIMLNAWYFQVRNPQASFKDVFRFQFTMDCGNGMSAV